jgi:5-methylcytosine-specific restriction endonuclease McrA
MGLLNHRTLLLDATFRPVRVISWMRAMTLDFQDKVIVVETYDRKARSPSVEVSVPAVVALKRYHGHRPFKVRFRKRNVFIRDDFRCQFCGRRLSADELTIDHVIPRAQGGRSTWENVVSACEPCNHSKGNRTPHEANMHLLRPPARPKPGLHGVIAPQSTPPEWGGYLRAGATA